MKVISAVQEPFFVFVFSFIARIRNASLCRQHMMAAKSDAGLNKVGFVLFKRIGRISELVHWVLPNDDAESQLGLPWLSPAATQLLTHW